MQLLRNRRGDGLFEATPRFLAALIAAVIAFLLSRWLGRELDDAEKELKKVMVAPSPTLTDGSG
jgi:hypothetical protein